MLGHWLDLMNVDGWIPREQILGQEALSKVPAVSLLVDALLACFRVPYSHVEYLKLTFEGVGSICCDHYMIIIDLLSQICYNNLLLMLNTSITVNCQWFRSL